MKTNRSIAAWIPIALASLPGLAVQAEEKQAARPSTVSASVAANDAEGKARVTIRIDKDGKTETKVIELDSDDPARAGAVIAEAIKDKPDKKASDASGRKMTFLGVALDETAGDAAQNLPIEKGAGLRVTGVTKDSPAAQAGLKENDILARLDDQLLISPQQVIVLVRSRKPGDKVRLTFFRDGQEQHAETVLAETDASELGGPESDGKRRFGERLLQNLKDDGARQLLKSRLFRLDPSGRLSEEHALDGDEKKWSVPWGEWRRDFEESRKKIAEESARAHSELAGRLKEEVGRLRADSEKLYDQFRRAQDELVEKLASEVAKAQDAARQAQRAAEKALDDLKEKQAAEKDAKAREKRGESRGASDGPDEKKAPEKLRKE
jgi:PDZ domain